MARPKAAVRTWLLFAGALLAPTGLSGCGVFNFNPFAMGFATPIPVMPWVTERMEEKYCIKNDYRTPIMPPIKEGTRPLYVPPRLSLTSFYFGSLYGLITSSGPNVLPSKERLCRKPSVIP